MFAYILGCIAIVSTGYCIHLCATNIHTENNSLHETFLKDEECIICIEMYEPQDVLRTLKCNHTFHKQCIETWLEYSSNTHCPICSNPC